MNILVINSGSSSIKYKLFRMPEAEVLASGLADRIGQPTSSLTHDSFVGGEARRVTPTGPIPDHETGLQAMVQCLVDPAMGVIRQVSDIQVVGHRVVHGGEKIHETTLITPEVIGQIRDLCSLAPLHNPPNLLGIEVCLRLFPTARQVAVFDTAFHQTMPPVAYQMPLPSDLYETHAIRNYGFHGTSHKYVAGEAMRFLGRDDVRMITLHLGNGCSASAIHRGHCLDTSMGMGPLSGLVMGTRPGDLDPSVIFYLIETLGWSPAEVKELLNKRSGLLGMTGLSDMRDIRDACERGDRAALLAREIYVYRIRKQIGAYAAVLNGLDVLVFTAGVGENHPTIRALCVRDMEWLGIKIDETRNNASGDETREISANDSRVKVLVVPTREELEIARQCHACVKG